MASILADGPAAVARLRARGAPPSTRPRRGRLARTREGGHSAFRVVHAGGDATGAEVERALVAAAADRRLPLLTGHVAVDALRAADGRITGLAVLDDAGRPGVLRAPAVLLASGGYGQLYASTTNPDTATGDGVALALRAGAPAADLEFVQFHPTVLYDGPATGRRPLVTEAVRGEGAVLLDRAGRRFMTGVHPLADLAPRDVVAAAITRRSWSARRRLRVPGRPRDRRVSRSGSPRCTRPAGRPGSTRSPSRSRSPRPRTTRAAACSPTRTGAPRCPGCTRPARWPAPACTGRTGWPPTACWRAW